MDERTIDPRADRISGAAPAPAPAERERADASGPRAAPADAELGLLEVDGLGLPVVLGAEAELAIAADDPVERAALARLYLGMLSLCLLIVSTYMLPQAEFARPWRAGEGYLPFWNLIGREWLDPPAAHPRAAVAPALLAESAAEGGAPVVAREARYDAVDRWPAYRAHEADPHQVVRAIEDPEALASFFNALGRSDLGVAGAVTRVGHWGDSILGNDGITSELRVRMQRRFGDAGHGFHAISRYDASYRHRGLRFEEREGVWSNCFIIRRCAPDGHYGYGGARASAAVGAWSRFAPAREGPVGRSFSSFELWYVARPGAGRVAVQIDGGEEIVLDTGAPSLEDRWERFELGEGTHEVEVRARGGGRVALYGAVLEREGPGVVWDGMALVGAFTRRLLEQDPDHWARQLRHRELDLVVFMFGGNDLTRAERKGLDRHHSGYRELLARTRAALPETACLVVAPIDHGERRGGQITSRPALAQMVEVQRAIAHEAGCAFFDTYAAMGGEGSIARWYRARPKLANGDLSHPTRAGHRVLAELLYAALLDAYRDFRQVRVGEAIAPSP